MKIKYFLYITVPQLTSETIIVDPTFYYSHQLKTTVCLASFLYLFASKITVSVTLAHNRVFEGKSSQFSCVLTCRMPTEFVIKCAQYHLDLWQITKSD